MIIAIPVYEKVDLLDVAGPYEMFNWLKEKDPSFDVMLLSKDGKPVTTRDGMTFHVRASFDSAARLDVIWVPGGDPDGALKPMMNGTDPAYVDFLRKRAPAATWVCSVCEGALLLAAAGLLDGYKATTHWAFLDCLKSFPRIEVMAGPPLPRFVVDRNRVTGGGISSGLDEALKVIQLIARPGTAEWVQTVTQYFPDPPVHAPEPKPDGCPFSWKD
ncbi:MAG TPA: DJ-1/PfpI family protein [Reyranella sp.]|nr:DJ-1/PfpI family protein [Reyranella sp.]